MYLKNSLLSGPDGPYLAIEDHCSRQYKLTLIQDDESGFYVSAQSYNGEECTFRCVVDNQDNDSFSVSLNPFAHPHINPGMSEAPDKIFVLSDIEGNFNALYSLLVAHHIMDKNFNWIFGKNALVVLGDVMDRGENVTQCLWLIYRLEELAAKQGGSVHFILGNHELMNQESDLRFRHKKYAALEQLVTEIEDEVEAHNEFYAHNNFLLGWILNKNTMERIGNTLFVHGGVSPELLEGRISIPRINSHVRHHLKGQRVEPELMNLLIGSYGPLWYRGMAADHGTYSKVSESVVDQVLDFYSSDRLVIGHSVTVQVKEDYHGKVIRTDVLHSRAKFSELTQGVMIEGEKVYRAYGNGTRELLVAERPVVIRENEPA
jgi:hypothetical protein